MTDARHLDSIRTSLSGYKWPPALGTDETASVPSPDASRRAGERDAATGYPCAWQGDRIVTAEEWLRAEAEAYGDPDPNEPEGPEPDDCTAAILRRIATEMSSLRPASPRTKGYCIAGEPVTDAVGDEFGRLIAERDHLAASAPPPERAAPRCPNCGSRNVGPTSGNAVGNTMDCLDCHTDFTPPRADGRAEREAIVEAMQAVETRPGAHYVRGRAIDCRCKTCLHDIGEAIAALRATPAANTESDNGNPTA